jgi:hypothetical protein
MRLLFYLLLVFTSFSCLDKPKKYSLLTWENIETSYGAPFGTALVSYTLTDSGYLREVLDSLKLSYTPNPTSYPASLYDNRYIINSMGDIYDVEERKMIFEHIGNDFFIEKIRHFSYEQLNPFRNDSARHEAIKDPYYFFDLQLKQVGSFARGNRYFLREEERNRLNGFLAIPPGLLSPGKDRLAYFSIIDTIANSNYIYDSAFMICGWTRVFPTYGNIVVKTGMIDSTVVLRSVRFNFGLRHPNSLPLVWLNEHQLLTQRENGRLVMIDIESGKAIDFPPLQGVLHCSYPPRLERTADNQIIYICPASDGEMFRVNTAAYALEKVKELTLSGNYAIKPITPNPNWEYVAGYSYNKKMILEDSTVTQHHSIADDKIAIQCKERTPTPDRYDHYWNTIRIYQGATGKWTPIRVENLKQLIGWHNE